MVKPNPERVPDYVRLPTQHQAEGGITEIRACSLSRPFRDLDLPDRDRQKLKAAGIRLVTITQNAGLFLHMVERTS